MKTLTQEALPDSGNASFNLDSKVTLSVAIHFLIIFSVLTGVAMKPAKAEETDLFEQQKLSSHFLINLFLEKVEQQNLVLFEHSLGRDDLQPHQVAFVYNMNDDSLIIRLCFNLKKKIAVPKFENYYVEKITVETDRDGNIIQVKSHISPIDEQQPR